MTRKISIVTLLVIFTVFIGIFVKVRQDYDITFQNNAYSIPKKYFNDLIQTISPAGGNGFDEDHSLWLSIPVDELLALVPENSKNAVKKAMGGSDVLNFQITPLEFISPYSFDDQPDVKYVESGKTADGFIRYRDVNRRFPDRYFDDQNRQVMICYNRQPEDSPPNCHRYLWQQGFLIEYEIEGMQDDSFVARQATEEALVNLVNSWRKV